MLYQRHRSTVFHNNYHHPPFRLCGHQQRSLVLVMPIVQMEKTPTLSPATILLEITLDSLPQMYRGHHIWPTNTRKTVMVSWDLGTKISKWNPETVTGFVTVTWAGLCAKPVAIRLLRETVGQKWLGIMYNYLFNAHSRYPYLDGSRTACFLQISNQFSISFYERNL